MAQDHSIGSDGGATAEAVEEAAAAEAALQRCGECKQSHKSLSYCFSQGHGFGDGGSDGDGGEEQEEEGEEDEEEEEEEGKISNVDRVPVLNDPPASTPLSASSMA
jgi:hypothetical protein